MKLIDLLATEIRNSAAYNSNVQVAPSVILWTDTLRQWEPALPLLQAAMPELIVLGDYAPERKQVQPSGSNVLSRMHCPASNFQPDERRSCIYRAWNAATCVQSVLARTPSNRWLSCSTEVVGGSTTTLAVIGR